MVDSFDFFLLFQFKNNLIKSEIVGFGVLKGFQVVFYGMRRIDLNNGTRYHLSQPK